MPFRENLEHGTRISMATEVLRALMGRSKYTLPALGLAAFEKLPQWLVQEQCGRRGG